MKREVTYGSKVRVDWEGSRVHDQVGIVVSIGPASYDYNIKVAFEEGEFWVPEDKLTVLVRQR